MDVPLIHSEKIMISASAPFSFGLSAEIFAGGDSQISAFEKCRFRQTIRADGKLILVTLESAGTVSKPKLCAELKSNKELTQGDKRKAEETIRVLFNLDFDLSPFYEELKADKVMASLTRKLCGLKSPTTQTAFEALVDSIVEQQISLKVANGLENKLIKKFGDALNLEGETYFTYPTPQKLASTSSEELQSCGPSRRKTEYIMGIAEFVATGKLQLEKLKTCNKTEEIIEELDRVRGIGLWTAELTVLRGMQKFEALPADDLGLRRVISHYYFDGKDIVAAQARQIAKNWGKWKGLAAYYLIVADMLGAEP